MPPHDARDRSEDPTLLNNPAVQNVLGAPDSDPSFWALYEDLPPHVRSLIQASVRSDVARDQVAEAFRGVSVEVRQKVREVHQHYLAQQTQTQVRLINGRLSALEKEHEDYTQGHIVCRAIERQSLKIWKMLALSGAIPILLIVLGWILGLIKIGGTANG